MSIQNHNGRTTPNAVTREQLDKLLNYQRATDRLDFLTARALAYQDLGLKPGAKYDPNFLEKLGIDPLDLEESKIAMFLAGNHADGLYAISIRAFAEDIAARHWPAQNLGLEDSVMRHIVN